MKILTHRILLLLICAFFGIISTLAMYLMSEDVMQNTNPFIRRFPPHPVQFTKMFDLTYNSYYFAGYHEGNIYLGNQTAPLTVTVIDSLLATKEPIHISAEKSDFQFRAIRLKVKPPYFYLLDGTVPCIYAGNTTDWKARLRLRNEPFFTFAEPIDSTAFVFRANSNVNGVNILGTLDLQHPAQLHFAPELLQKQSYNDGIFDTDGSLLYSDAVESIVYTYAYRNQFIVADKSANLKYRGRTIDTMSRAQIKVAQLASRKQRKMAAPPVSINAHTAIFGHLLFVDSPRRGKYDDKGTWEKATTIDVYDLKRNIYVLSFYIDGIGNHKLNGLLVTPTHIYALINTHLVSYKIIGNLKKEILGLSETASP